MQASWWCLFVQKKTRSLRLLVCVKSAYFRDLLFLFSFSLHPSPDNPIPSSSPSSSSSSFDTFALKSEAGLAAKPVLALSVFFSRRWWMFVLVPSVQRCGERSTSASGMRWLIIAQGQGSWIFLALAKERESGFRELFFSAVQSTTNQYTQRKGDDAQR